MIQRGQLGQTHPERTALLVLMSLLLTLSACNTATPPAADTTGFALRVDPRAETVTPADSASATTLQAQAESEGTRLLVEGQDIATRELRAQFRSPNAFVISVRIQNITDLTFTQPTFTLSSSPEGALQTSTPPVIDAQFGDDGVFSPGETSERLSFEGTFSAGEPFTFTVDIRAEVRGATTCTDPVSIPDEVLEEEIRGALDKLEGDLTCEDLASLEELDLDLSTEEVSNLEGLQFAVNLTGLDLDDNTLSDISPLESLTKLSELRLEGNALADISALAGLRELTTLFLSDNNISDISPLRNLTNLTRLDLDENNVSNVSPLENLTSLTDLSLLDNAVVDISPLAGLTKLTDLDLDGNSVSDITSLAGLTNLESLDLRNNTVQDLSPLAGLTNLGSLNLNNNTVQDLSPLAGLTNLGSLELSGNSISDLSPLGGLPALSRLDISANTVQDLSPIEVPTNFTQLSSLNLDNNLIQDLSPFEGGGLPALRFLNLNANDFSDIAPLASLTNLLDLELGNNNLNNSDIAPLEGFVVDRLSLQGNAIGDISALVNNPEVGGGDEPGDSDVVDLTGNPLSAQALEDIDTLVQRGVVIRFAGEILRPD